MLKDEIKKKNHKKIAIRKIGKEKQNKK